MLTKVVRASTLLFVAIEIYDSHVSLLLLLAVSQKSFANVNWLTWNNYNDSLTKIFANVNSAYTNNYNHSFTKSFANVNAAYMEQLQWQFHKKDLPM
jgi:hypothetical protein